MSEGEPATPACALSGVELRRRERAWKTVTDQALRACAPIPGGVRLTFSPERSVVDDLVDLVHAERGCCGWASWTLLSTPEAAVVEVTAEGDRAHAVRALFGVR